MKRLILILFVLFLSTSVNATNSFIEIKNSQMADILFSAIGGRADYFWLKGRGWLYSADSDCKQKLKKSSHDYWNNLIKKLGAKANIKVRGRGGLICAMMEEYKNYICTLEEDLNYCQINRLFLLDYPGFVERNVDAKNLTKIETIRIGSTVLERLTQYNIQETKN